MFKTIFCYIVIFVQILRCGWEKMCHRKKFKDTEVVDCNLQPADYENLARDLLEKAKLELKRVWLVKAAEVRTVPFENRYNKANFVYLAAWIQHLAPEYKLVAIIDKFCDNLMPFRKAR